LGFAFQVFFSYPHCKIKKELKPRGVCMFLQDFSMLVSIEYPDWQTTYSPIVSDSSRIFCNAVIKIGEKQEIIGVYRQDKRGTHWYLKKKDGTYLKGNDSASIYIAESEFFNNIIRSIDKGLSKPSV